MTNWWCRLFGHKWEHHGTWHKAGPTRVCLRCYKTAEGWAR